MAAKRKENYLDYIPVYNPLNSWEEKDGNVTIHMVHRGFYNIIAQKLFHTPRVSHIDLDTYGTFVWKQIDGKRTVGEVAEKLKAEYGEAAEPLYDRLVKYMQILRNNQFIYFQGKDRVPK